MRKPFFFALYFTCVINARHDCSLNILNGDTYNLSTLGVVKGTDSAGNGYAIDLCGDISSASVGCSPDSNEAPAWQFFHGSCFRIGNAGFRSIAPLSEGPGLVIKFDGGSDCGAGQRRISVLLSCADSDAASIAISESTSEPCLYEARILSRAACPVDCARDADGLVCGGWSRGECARGKRGKSFCARAHGEFGPPFLQ